MQPSHKVLIQTDAPETHDLGFCTVAVLSQHVAEVIVNAEVEMTLAMVEHYHTFLLTHLSAPMYLLINKLHPYSYTFEAQRALATIPEIQAMAVLSYNSVTDMATKTLAALPREAQWNLKLFSDRGDALAWLTNLPITRQQQL